MYESPVGFRHGPKSLINDQTPSWSLDPLILIPVSMIWTWFEKLQGIKLPVKSSSLTDQAAGIEHVREVLVEASADSLDIYRAFPYIIYGQLISL